MQESQEDHSVLHSPDLDRSGAPEALNNRRPFIASGGPYPT